METAVAVVNQGAMLAPMKVEELIRQVSLVQTVMKSVMLEGTHYGKIPGCGDKPTLYKSGAEKLAFVFRLASFLEAKYRDLPNGHREYEVTCTLKTIGGDVVVSQGMGLCSTMESKYRYRTGPKEFTGKPVPDTYWHTREINPDEARKLIGGPGFAVAKNPENQNKWEIVKQGGKVEHENPADYYNTVLKMAKKRAQVDATLSGTAASDCFDQDLEDLNDNLREAEATVAPSVSGSQPLSTVPRGTQPLPTEQAPRPSAQTTESAKKTDSTSSTGNQALDWRNSTIPFGKAKGAKLGELPTENLMWWINNYVPKPFGNAKTPSKNDLAFRANLDAAKAEMVKRKDDQDAVDDSHPAPPPQDNIDEDVPF